MSAEEAVFGAASIAGLMITNEAGIARTQKAQGAYAGQEGGMVWSRQSGANSVPLSEWREKNRPTPGATLQVRPLLSKEL